jgi:ribose transport system ATP-binding protein
MRTSARASSEQVSAMTQAEGEVVMRRSESTLLQVNNVTKQYSTGTLALRGVSLQVDRGTVHGLVGANGAGKSTLIKLISGVEQPTSGAIRWGGKQAAWRSPSQALDAGLATVYQHTPLVPQLSVLENIYIGPDKRRIWNPANHREEFERLTSLTNYEIDPDASVGQLSVGARQMVGILQAVARSPRLILLDEPTASLSQEERVALFAVIDRLKASGTAFVYVSHFLDEVMSLSDEITVLRDGRLAQHGPASEFTEDELVFQMVGEKLAAAESESLPTSIDHDAPPAVSVRNLTVEGVVDDISFAVQPGEILGLAGLLGSGRTEILKSIFVGGAGVRGEVSLGSRAYKRRNPARSVKEGMAFVPEDRVREGFIGSWEIWRNVSLPHLASISVGSVVPINSREQRNAEWAIERLRIKAESANDDVSQLSGGNAQKVVFAKWLFGKVRLLLLDEPGAGIDVSAKADLFRLVRELASDGCAVVIVDSEFEQLLATCHRVIVLHRGKAVGDFASSDTDVHKMTALASGLSR